MASYHHVALLCRRTFLIAHASEYGVASELLFYRESGLLQTAFLPAFLRILSALLFLLFIGEEIALLPLIRLRRIRRTYEMYSFRFADVQAEFQEQDTEQEMDLKVLLDTLQSDSPALTKEQNDRLFYAVLEDYMDVPTQAGKLRKMKADPHYNALQVKYAYAITCHKAQGGQWRNVFLDIGYITEEMLGEDFYRWLYTAFTRATECLYLVNLPSEFIE